jgi:hypothetical protein
MVKIQIENLISLVYKGDKSDNDHVSLIVKHEVTGTAATQSRT